MAQSDADIPDGGEMARILPSQLPPQILIVFTLPF
jgi:hypothetical protein